MATQSISSVVRAILSANPALPADEVVKRAKARGITAHPDSVRHVVHNLRREFRPKTPALTPAPAPAAARTTPVPKPVAAAAPVATGPDVSGVLANVALVNRVVGLSGGPENARQVAEAVRACGGVDAFLQHLKLVAGILQTEATAR